MSISFVQVNNLQNITLVELVVQTEVILKSSKRKTYHSFLKDHIMGKISVLLELCLIVIDSRGKKTFLFTT